MNLKKVIQSLVDEHPDMTLKDVIIKAGLNYNNILNKFQRDTLYYTDVEKILNVLEKKITFTDKHHNDK